jgi:hypothetical protein
LQIASCVFTGFALRRAPFFERVGSRLFRYLHVNDRGPWFCGVSSKPRISENFVRHFCIVASPHDIRYRRIRCAILMTGFCDQNQSTTNPLNWPISIQHHRCALSYGLWQPPRQPYRRLHSRNIVIGSKFDFPYRPASKSWHGANKWLGLSRPPNRTQNRTKRQML